MKLLSIIKYVSLFLFLCPSNGEIMELTDETFEHETQASTGMTTGSWLLFFKAARCPHCKELEPVMTSLSEDEHIYENGIVIGSIDVLLNPEVSTRFGIRGFPTLVYIHRGRMHLFKGKTRDFDSLKRFVMGEFLNDGPGELVPKPQTSFGRALKTGNLVMLELIDGVKGKHGTVGYAVVVMVTLVMVLLLSMISICFLPAKKQKHT